MGHDVSPVGNHQLDMSSTEALARDISERFRANVKYGYQDWLGCDSDGIAMESTFEVIVHGVIKRPQSHKTLTLLDGNYQLHQILKNHENSISNLPYFKNGAFKADIEDAKRGRYFELFDMEKDENYGTIFEDTFRDFFNDFTMRWWTFCMAFTDSYHKQYLDYVTEFRQNVMALYRKIGGTNVAYLDDQGETQYLTEIMYDWGSIKNELNIHFKETTLAIPDFMKERKPLPVDELPLAFFDDFSDLK